jgi:hypothetical protein
MQSTLLGIPQVPHYPVKYRNLEKVAFSDQKRLLQIETLRDHLRNIKIRTFSKCFSRYMSGTRAFFIIGHLSENMAVKTDLKIFRKS